MEMTTNGRRVEYAPRGHNDSGTTGVISVSLSKNEEVEWSWFYGHNCSYVCGYVIKRKS